jgi:hypothetical protein
MQSPVNGEVTIICLTDEVILRDLGVRLTRGAKVEVPLSAALKSRDLQRAKIDGTVSTQTLRASTIRTQEYASSDTTTSRSPRFQPHPPPPPAPQVDMAPLMDAMRAMAEELKSLRAELVTLKQAPPEKVTVREVPSVVVPQAHGKPVPQATTEEPVFIPSGITGKGLKPTLDVSAQENSTPGVDDAVAALKSARKRSPR